MRPRFSFVALATAGTICIAGSISQAQTLPFERYTMNDGLVSNGVNVLLQDSRGFLWIGTADGVSVYDGYEFRNYSESGGHNLALVTALAESRVSPGTIWVGSLGTGLNRVDNKSIIFASNPKLESGAITGMIEDESGALWFGTERGLYILDIAIDSLPVKLLDGYIPDVVKARDGRVWVSTKSGVDIFSRQREKLATINLGRYHAGQADQMLASTDSSVWVATDSRTILQFRDTVLVRSRSYQGSQIKTMSEDSHGYLWLCTEAGYLIKLPKAGSTGEPDLITAADGLAADALTVLVDREDNVWIGLLGHGLQKLTYQNVAIFPIDPLPLGYSYQPPLCSDSGGGFWAIAIDGLLELLRNSSGKWILEMHTLNELGLSNRPASVQFGPKGTMWVGTVDGTIHEFEVKRFDFRRSMVQGVREFRPGLQSVRGKLKIFTVDRDENVWCNLLDSAVVVFDKGFKHIRTFTESDGLPSTNIAAMFLDRDNVMWFGGVGKGIASIPAGEYREGKLRTLKSADGLPDEAIRAIFQDARGRMIFGTRYSGLAIFDNGTFTTLKTSGGLSNNCVWSIAGDGPDHVWVCTQVGLQRINLRTLQPEAAIDVLGSDQTICCRRNGGTVVAWRYGSLLVYETSEPTPIGIPPPIYVTQLEVNARPVDVSGPLAFAHDLNTCTFEFVGISFREQNGLRYRYRLLGLDPEWSSPTAQRAVTFAQLPPGKYSFEVQAITSGGISSTAPASMTFTIQPPLWRTWWAYIVYAIAILASGVSWRRYEITRIRRRERQEAAIREAELRAEMAEQQKELEKQQTRVQIARDLHDEVGSTLSSISFFAEAIKQEPEKSSSGGTARLLSLIAESSAHAKEAMSDIIWSINPANDSWDNIASKLRRYASDVFESKGITHSIEMPPPGTIANIDPERRRHLWLLYKEIVANVARHSRCTESRIHLMVRDGQATLVISDNGIGFDQRRQSAGQGLKNIGDRGRLLGATVNMQTSPGSGTSWRISFPL